MTPQQAHTALAQGKTLRLYIAACEGYVTLTYHDALTYLIGDRADLLSLKPEPSKKNLPLTDANGWSKDGIMEINTNKAHQPHIVTISGPACSGKTHALRSMAGSYDGIFSVKGVLAYLKGGYSPLDTLYVDEATKEDLEKIKLASVGSTVKRIYVAGDNL